MTKRSFVETDGEALKTLLLDMAYERSAPVLLETIVKRLADLPDVALARIWSLMPGDICPSCLRRDKCTDRSKCLHLSASAGHSITGRNHEWSRTDGPFRRTPFGFPRVGQIAQTKEPLELPHVKEGAPLPSGVDSFKYEKIIGFSGQPLLYKESVIGVLALFTRKPPRPERITWLRMIANHAAIAVANARAFHQIESLKEQLELENAYLQEELSEVQESDHIVGQSHAIRNILKQVDLVAPTDANVLLLGESGTGKELVAREIHKKSRRHDRPLVKVNCASIPRELYESEFFGHVRGAFTGAIKDREGRFAVADGGTLFLDEIGEIPLDLQGKLLQVIQEGRYERVGEETTRHVDVRIIAATNRDLKREMEKGRFRQDLYYRLSVIPVEVPPLRHRKEDIPQLALHFIKLSAKKMNRPLPGLAKIDLEALQRYHWPGNIRELQNTIERAVILSQSKFLTFDLPTWVPNGMMKDQKSATPILPEQKKILTNSEIRKLERENILAALKACDWKVYGLGGAAELLEVKPTTLSSRIQKMGLHRRQIYG